jgi:hypothetical protein
MASMTPQQDRAPGTTVTAVMHVGGLNLASEKRSRSGC